jgi:hypothetical protein
MEVDQARQQDEPGSVDNGELSPAQLARTGDRPDLGNNAIADEDVSALVSQQVCALEQEAVRGQPPFAGQQVMRPPSARPPADNWSRIAELVASAASAETAPSSPGVQDRQVGVAAYSRPSAPVT